MTEETKIEIESLERFISDKRELELRTQRLSSLSSELNEKTLPSEVRIFKALADTNRLKIIKLLKEGELCVCELTAVLTTSQSTVSHHLSVLKNAGLIKERKEGKWSYFRLSDGAVIEILNQAKLLIDE
ncbi:metalloregulator ArsR/SmtB family transcription factor [Methanosarcina sp.]|uniref:ArsR/SmtB family transcription factor n=1 Tax=Methanosarcina sp. TaxID=2213 RepID=UPI002988E838|nr:metalloregulator ArsR/SmtB family transcription factor [Methanosarcina sp.]MDW5550440.1 metalloregulator ArsR/SmtB family transcription factor [Methanosarcina sp.]MDW5554764.1 metalloregulator ArsR/SmtB family transcription factor [Methanosarcina sp.]MDW5559937.1 metalloregulator ArsR/SmtB family transcription factor [Methanosarcina sp.]